MSVKYGDLVAFFEKGIGGSYAGDTGADDSDVGQRCSFSVSMKTGFESDFEPAIPICLGT